MAECGCILVCNWDSKIKTAQLTGDWGIKPDGIKLASVCNPNLRKITLVSNLYTLAILGPGCADPMKFGFWGC